MRTLRPSSVGVWVWAALVTAIPHAGVAQTGGAAVLVPDGESGPPARGVAAFRLDSRVLGESRRVHVALPPSHALTDRPYPLLLVFDGEALTTPVVQQTDALSAVGHMPEVVVVGVENTDRIRDLSPPGLAVSMNGGRGRADLFLRFLEEELRPALVERFRAGGPVILVGHSSGGLFVNYAVSQNPGLFGTILSLDAPMHLGEGAAVDFMVDAARSGAQHPVRLVSLDARFGWPEEGWRRFASQADGGWWTHRSTMDTETHQSMVWPGIHDGLRRLFDDYSEPAGASGDPTDRLRGFDARGGGGAAVPPPAPLLAAAADQLVDGLDLPGAEAVVERLADGYGESTRVSTLRARIAEARDEELEGPTLEEMRAAPMPAAADLEPLLGEWRGYTIREGDNRRSPLTLSVHPDGDGVSIELGVGQAPPRPAEYVAVRDGEIHMGYMNGMRPRGMLVYEGKVDGDVYEGEFVLRGVVFRMPDGSSIPTTLFRLERVGG